MRKQYAQPCCTGTGVSVERGAPVPTNKPSSVRRCAGLLSPPDSWTPLTCLGHAV